MRFLRTPCVHNAVIASGAKQSRDRALSGEVTTSGLLRSARNDDTGCDGNVGMSRKCFYKTETLWRRRRWLPAWDIAPGLMARVATISRPSAENETPAKLRDLVCTTSSGHGRACPGHPRRAAATNFRDLRLSLGG